MSLPDKRGPLAFVASLAFALSFSTMVIGGGVPKAPAQMCAGADCKTAAASSTGALKWHPGHYMMLRSRHRNPSAELPQIDSIGSNSNVKGSLVMWVWSDIEGDTLGSYDFSSIDQYLQRLKSEPQPKRLIIRIEDRAFNSGGSSVPAYLKTSAYNGGEVAMENGTVARIWEQPVMDRLIALYQALAARYDGDPYVEGISTEETSIGFNTKAPAPNTYSAGALLTQFSRLATSARAAWKHSEVFLTTNYLGSDTQMEQLIQTAEANQVVLGGPDTWGMAWVQAGTRGLQSDFIERGIRGSGSVYIGKVAQKAEIEDTELGVMVAFDPSDLYNVAYNVMQANYIWWDYNTYAGTATNKWSTGILPLINSVNGKTYTACPPSYNGNCSTN
jgi:hypothetical protein